MLEDKSSKCRDSASLLSGAEVIMAVARKEKAVTVEAVLCEQGGGHADDVDDIHFLMQL